MNVHTENITYHQRLDRCNQMMEMRLRTWDVELSQRAGEMRFSMYAREYGPQVEGSTQFK